MSAASRAPWWRFVLIVLGMILLADALWLIISRGILSLGVTVPGVVGAGLVFVGWRWNALMRWQSRSPVRRWVWRAGWTAFIAWVISVAWFFASIQRHADATPGINTSVRAMIVLGSGSTRCRVSPTLASRLEHARIEALARPRMAIVVSGGHDFRLPCSEAELMADYLAARGIPRERIWLEDRSTSTETNLIFSRRVLSGHGIAGSEPLLLVTSDFHLPRAMRIAAKAGFSDVHPSAAQTPAYIRYNWWLREYFATFSSWILGET